MLKESLTDFEPFFLRLGFEVFLKVFDLILHLALQVIPLLVLSCQFRLVNRPVLLVS